MSHNFKIGDEVICVKAFDGKNEAVNQLGRVVAVDGGYVSVEFYKHIAGHNSSGAGKFGYCWNFYEEDHIHLIFSKPLVYTPFEKAVAPYRNSDLVFYRGECCVIERSSE